MTHPVLVVVVGGGAAGGAAAHTLAAYGGDRVAVVGVAAEATRPYNRTTVNKGLLTGAVTAADIAVPGLDHPAIEWRRGTRATAVDPASRTVALDDGSTLAAAAVVVATGADPRPLPGPVTRAVAARVLSLRTPADTARLNALAGTGPVVVAGAGLIGTEIAGTLACMSPAVTVLDPAPHPLHRQVGPGVGRWAAATLRAAGVVVGTGRAVAEIRPAPAPGPALAMVELDDGTLLPAAAVVVSLGVQPATGWLTAAGLPIDPATAGVLVDPAQRVVNHPGLYAAGDLAAMPGPDRQPVRLEHWGSAVEQGRRAGLTVLADLGLTSIEPEPASLPGYSSYVADTKLTILGWPTPNPVEVPLLGRPGDQRFLVGLARGDRIVGAVGVGGARAANRLRPLLDRRATVAEATAAVASLTAGAS